ncbi:MAG: benzoyl-CoA 2,3-epoxidase subunit BoxB [Actinobacteria bacterium]|nr:benzoyl-CoA 2,3-epoxidase subunit BoxB [Actinomycetota bacterium]MCL6094814.1 benzoyl-CoA 2,3-epoxidase subunit BoxB [Actinomycetota bacterium]
MMKVDYAAKIPNNVNLAEDRQLTRALESWQPKYLAWWNQLGPKDFANNEVFLRTAVDVGQEGWANFGYVTMPEYRWGIFLAEPKPDRRISFGEHIGQPVWNEVPGEYRFDLRRLIAVQGDTEPASVEQQRHLGKTAPSLYDLRNLFQVNVEEGRHLWAMVYLLHRYFGKDGREEADALLERHSGDPDRPRLLGAFNEPTPDWLSFYLFTYFTDRDGKFQLHALTESAFDPLARTTQFMLKEEAHHMFVGATGVARVIQRTAELMKEHDTDDIRQYGGINLSIIQKYLNFHYSITLDLFGGDTSSNAANYYASGLKGRYHESERQDDHRLLNSTYKAEAVTDGHIDSIEVPTITALNQILQDDFIADCQNGVDRWNRILSEAGITTKLYLPHRGFNRQVGIFADYHITPEGVICSDEEWELKKSEWLPTPDDRSFVASLMVPVREPGKMASWLAPPATGIANKPIDYIYVKL